MYRTVVEMSHMNNNDEHVFFTTAELKTETFRRAIRHSEFDDPRVVLSRPVTNIEVQDGLNVTYRGRLCDEPAPESTRFLDAYVRIGRALKAWVEIRDKHEAPNITNTWILAHYVGNAYFDCMSGGMQQHVCSILRHLCRQPDIDLTKPVYPGKHERAPYDNSTASWYTLADWLDLTKDCPDFEPILTRLREYLPPLLPSA